MIIKILNWVFGILFLAIGILNILLVHPIPGLLYILFSLAYFPPIHSAIKRKLNFNIPNAMKIIIAILVLWASLAVGDLMEVFESWFLK